ncbi:MAG: maleylpyruvate isomerase N-terminal domain-containing protein [Ornithinimicrobium sp.]
MSAGEQHREMAGAFTATVDGVAPGDWDLPAPPQGWVARDVVGHLTTWFPAFLTGNTGIRASGHFGPKLDVPENADVQTRLLGFVGRTRPTIAGAAGR